MQGYGSCSSQEQFRQLLFNIMDCYQKKELNFYEFMFLLKQYNIKFYSKQEVAKITKQFAGTLNKIPIRTPFASLQLVSLQITYNQKYYIVKVSKYPRKMEKPQNDRKFQHNPKTCLADFKKIMFRLHGTQMNWFKVLGGLTVAIKIPVDTFLKNINTVLKNSNHSQCGVIITKLFLLATEKEIDWSVFMGVIRQKANSAKHQNSLLKKKRLNRIQSALQNRKNEQFKSHSLAINFSSTFSDFKDKSASQALDFKRCTLHDRIQIGLARKSSIYKKSGSVDINALCQRRKVSVQSRLRSRGSYLVQKGKRCSTQSDFRNQFFLC